MFASSPDNITTVTEHFEGCCFPSQAITDPTRLREPNALLAPRPRHVLVRPGLLDVRGNNRSRPKSHSGGIIHGLLVAQPVLLRRWFLCRHDVGGAVGVGAVVRDNDGLGQLGGEAAGGAEAAGAAHALLEFRDLHHLGGVDALDDELGHAVALGHLEFGLGVVEQQDLDLAAVVGVDDAGARVDEVLGS